MCIYDTHIFSLKYLFVFLKNPVQKYISIPFKHLSFKITIFVVNMRQYQNAFFVLMTQYIYDTFMYVSKLANNHLNISQKCARDVHRRG